MLFLPLVGIHLTDSAIITVDGVRVRVEPSLHAALVRVRLPAAARRILVDQICINRSDGIGRQDVLESATGAELAGRSA